MPWWGHALVILGTPGLALGNVVLHGQRHKRGWLWIMIFLASILFSGGYFIALALIKMFH